jgi:hypothetical protein
MRDIQQICCGRRYVNTRPIEQRFWPRILVVASGCWEWQGARNGKGYGHIRYLGKVREVHRLVFELLGVSLPQLPIDHLCRNTACLNPTHLEPVSTQVNVLRGIGPTAINAKKTQCPLGHPLANENLYTYSDGRRACRQCLRQRLCEWKRRDRRQRGVRQRNQSRTLESRQRTSESLRRAYAEGRR